MTGLLKKTRTLNELLQRNGDSFTKTKEVVDTIADLLSSDVFLFDQMGKMIQYTWQQEELCGTLQEILKKGLSETWNRELSNSSQSIVNIENCDRRCIFSQEACLFPHRCVAIVPVIAANQRFATMMIAKNGAEFDQEEMILAEQAALWLGIAMLHEQNIYTDDQARKKAAVQMALETLSYSEREAIGHIFAEMDAMEGLLIASKIADRVGITRSVIVNALRKFESAGIIESKSLGMKGTYIKVLNECLPEELQKAN